MKISDQMKAFELCKSADEILGVAKKANIEMTAEQAGNLFNLLQSDDVSDEALAEVAGGFCIIYVDRSKKEKK